MKSAVFLFAMFTAAAAYAQQEEQADLISPKGPVTFIDSRLFDGRLSKELESGKDRVEIDVTSKISLSSIPNRMDKWLVAVAEEGSVEFKQMDTVPQRTRFIFGLVPLVFSALKARAEEKMYEPSKQYNVIVYYKKSEAGDRDATIEKIVFSKKKAP